VSVLAVTVKIIIGLVLLFAITKLLGKTQISQITPFDFLSSIVIGELFVHGVYAENARLFQLIYPIVLWGAIIYLIELLAEKSIVLRSFFEGTPAVIIRDSRIDKYQMKRNKLNLDQLLNLLRQNSVFSLGEVKYAILEMNGTLSVLKNSADASPSRRDLNLPETPVSLAAVFISDGRVLEGNLREYGYDLPWLEDQLKMQGVERARDVFYAEWRNDKGLSISRK